MTHAEAPVGSDGNSVIRNMLAGGGARLVAATSLHPIDLAKTRMQFQRKNAVPESHYYRHGLHAITQTVRTEGPLALYRGLLVRLIYVVPSAAVNFTLFAETKRALLDTRSSWYGPALGVAFAVAVRIAQTSIRTPFDVVKQQLQVQGMRGASLEQPHDAPLRGSATRTMQTIVRKESYGGFFSGFAATIARDVAFAAVYFGSYELFKWIGRRLDQQAQRFKFAKFGVAGALAGAVGTVFTIPLDVVKTRMQTQAQLQLPDGQRRYASSWDAVRTIHRHEGARAFWRGCGPRVVQTMPAAAITFSTFEFLSDQLQSVKFVN
jgi:solute carrier family 25 iron transporter 28/37